jgi:hypothetical protein
MYGHRHRLLPMAEYALINLHSYPFLPLKENSLYYLVLYYILQDLNIILHCFDMYNASIVNEKTWLYIKTVISENYRHD